MQGGNVSIAGCPMKRAMPRLIWSLINPTYLRANPLSMIQFFVRFSFSQTWHGVKPRTPLPNISSISLSCCCMAPAIWMGRSTLFFSLGLWSDLCRDVRNTLWFDFILRRTTQARVSCHVVFWWDSAPNRSLQWSFSCLAWFPFWLRQVWGNPLHGDCRPSDFWIYNFQCGNSSK